MAQQIRPTTMRKFLIVWLGQMVSTIGSYMTEFAISLWAWEITGQATSLALVAFFTQVPRILITPLAGAIVDRWNRKWLIMLGDTMAGLSTLAIMVLYLTDSLEIWHLYVTGAVNGAFGQLHELSYTASIATMVPKQHYSRASGLISVQHYGSNIFAPALAGVLYPAIGLVGISLIDFITFIFAISTVFNVRIPQPRFEQEHQNPESIWREMIFGCRYIFTRPSFLALLVSASLFEFAHDFGAALYSPMILARSGNNAQLLGSISAAAGVGGVIGAMLVSTLGGFKRRIHGYLMGMVGAGLSKIIFGVGRIQAIWLPAQFCSSLNFPLMGSSSDAIWLSKVKPEMQGRVFAARSGIVLFTSTLATGIAGPVADYIFEPAMMPGGTLAGIFGNIFGTGSGAGMALLYAIASICLLLVGCCGYAFRVLRDVEILVPDYDSLPLTACSQPPHQ